MKEGRREFKRPGLSFGGLATVAAIAWTSVTRAAEPIPVHLSPIVVRGGIVGIPLRLPPEGEGLPAEVRLRIVDPAAPASEVLGRVVYLAQPADLPAQHWTRSANPTVIRSLPANEDPRGLIGAKGPRGVRSIDAAMLLADLPDLSPDATLEVGGSVIRPVWIAPSPVLDEIDRQGLIDPEAVAPWRDDRPDPQSAFEWFRWTLIAPRQGERLPAPPGDAASQLFARHVAELWLAGIARVERQSPGVAESVRDWLTSVVHWADEAPSNPADRAGLPGLATWVADPADLSSLLTILLDQSRDDEAIMSATLAWMDARTPLALWVESDVAGEVTIAVANPLTEELVVTMQWLGGTHPPVATLVPYRTADRARIRRPADSPGADVSREPIILSIGAGAASRRVAFAPRTVQARPPALSFGAFVPALTLADVQAGRAGSVPQEWATAASLRRRDGHWEIFAECLTPRPNNSSELVEDSLTLIVGPRSLTVRRDGTLEADLDGVADIGVRNFEGRWRARIGIPDAWMPAPGAVGGVITMGLRRDAPAIHTTAVLARTAFSTETPTVEIDLSEWREGIGQR